MEWIPIAVAVLVWVFIFLFIFLLGFVAGRRGAIKRVAAMEAEFRWQGYTDLLAQLGPELRHQILDHVLEKQFRSGSPSGSASSPLEQKRHW